MEDIKEVLKTKQRAAYFKNSHILVKEKKLLDELSKSQFEKLESFQGKPIYEIAVEKLLCVLDHSSDDEYRLFLSEEEKIRLHNACTIVKLMMDWKFNYYFFYRTLCSVPYLPLEFLWELHVTGILPLYRYIDGFSSHPEVLSALKRSIITLCTSSSSEFPNAINISLDVFRFMVIQTHSKVKEGGGNLQANEVKNACQEMLKSIMESTVEAALTENADSSISQWTFFKWNGMMLEHSTMQAFCDSALTHVLRYSHKDDAFQALSMQKKWSSELPKPEFRLLVKKLFENLEAEAVMLILQTVIKAETVNWEILLFSLTVYITEYVNGPANIIAKANALLEQAFGNKSVYMLCCAFILVRHVLSVENPNSVQSYTKWFKETFGNTSTALLRDEESFKFFMSSASQLVPYEDEMYLKVHIDNPPYATGERKRLLNDYVTLAKSRVADAAKTPETVVEKILAAFESTGKIPSTVLEASMLHKHHYLTEFLPVILTPRVLPRHPDTRMKFIQTLKAAGKIPKDLYQKYEEGCQEATRSGGGSSNDSSFVRNDQLKYLVESFKSEMRNLGKKEGMSLRSQFVEFQASVQQILKNICCGGNGSMCSVKSVSEAFPHEEAMGELVSCYCYIQHVTAGLSTASSWKWDLIREVSNSPCLFRAFVHTLKKKLITSHESIVSEELQGLASLLAKSMISKHQELDSIRVVTEIYDTIPIQTCDEIYYFARLAFFYLKSALPSMILFGHHKHSSGLPPYIPESLVKKYQFVVTRLDPTHRAITKKSLETDDLFAEMSHISKSPVFQEWLSAAKLPLNEWLKYEGCITADSDYFEDDERQCYFLWCFDQWYVVPEAEVVRDVMPLRTQCSLIFRFMLSKNSNCAFIQQLLHAFSEHLQGLRTCAHSQHHQQFDSPWMLQEFVNIETKLDQKDRLYRGHFRILLERFLSFVLRMPAFLLFGDLPQQLYLKNESFALVDFINKLKLHCTEECLLSAEFTCHVLKGLLVLLDIEGDEFEMRNEVVKKFFSSLPLLSCSLTAHLHEIKRIYPEVLSHKQSNLSATLKAIDFILSSMSEETHTAKVVQQLVSLKNINKWVIGFAMMRRGIPKTDCTAWYDFTRPDIMKIIMAAVMFHIAFKVSVSMGIEDSTFENAAAALRLLVNKNIVKFLLPQFYKDSILKDILGETAWCHFPAGCLKLVLAAFPAEDMESLPQKTLTSWLLLLLKNFMECRNRCGDQSHEVTHFLYSYSEGKLQSRPFGLLSNVFLWKIKPSIDKILCSVPAASITALPMEVIEECDEVTKNILLCRRKV